MEISSEDSSDDDETTSSTNREVGSITSIGTISIYPACMIPKCNKKKLGQDSRCGSCSKRIAPACAEMGIRAIIGMVVNGDHKTYTVFNDNAQDLYKLVTGNDVCPKVESQFEDELFDSLPKQVSFVASCSNILTKISKV